MGYPTSHLGNFNVHLIWGSIGKNGKTDQNEPNCGQKLSIKTGLGKI